MLLLENIIDLKKKTLSLIEEINREEISLNDDPDIEGKVPYIINQILHKLERFKKLQEYTTIERQKKTK